MFELQRAMVQKLEFLSLGIHKKYGSGNILSHIIVDSNNVRPFVETTIIKTTTNIVRITYPLVILFIIDPLLSFDCVFCSTTAIFHDNENAVKP